MPRHNPIQRASLALLILVRVSDGLAMRHSYEGAGHPVSGVFDVETFTRNGVVVTPLATDGTVWKRVASDGRYGVAAVTVQFANGDVRRHPLTDDVAKCEWALKGPSLTAQLHYVVEPDGAIDLDGHIGRDAVQLRLRPVEWKRCPVL